MTATNDSNEYTTIDHPWLKKDDWLYLSIASGSGRLGHQSKEKQPVHPVAQEINLLQIMASFSGFFQLQ